jgi:hypothetical protein
MHEISTGFSKKKSGIAGKNYKNKMRGCYLQLGKAHYQNQAVSLFQQWPHPCALPNTKCTDYKFDLTVYCKISAQITSPTYTGHLHFVHTKNRRPASGIYKKQTIESS